MATKNKLTTGYEGGKEGLLSAMATFFLIVGIAGSGACFTVSYWSDLDFTPFWVAMGIVVFVQGLFLYAVTGAGADILRLLKKQNGLPFGGQISEAEPICKFTCSECSTVVDDIFNLCPNCKAKFD